jgi:exodeoxyribonuclease X
VSALILDTETTTIDEPEVIELGWRLTTNFSQLLAGTYDDAFCGRFTPRKPAAFGAMAVHHILPEDLIDLPPSEGALSYAPSAPQYWIGHNIDFDWKALGCPLVNRICTLAMARHLWPECDAHNLSAITYFLFGATPQVRDRLRGAHSALNDVDLCAAILQRCIEVCGATSFSELYRFSELARIPTIGYTALSGVPATFSPQAHTHSTADVVGLTASFSQVGHAHDYVRFLNGLTGTVSIAGGAGVTVSTASSSISFASCGAAPNAVCTSRG